MNYARPDLGTSAAADHPSTTDPAPVPADPFATANEEVPGRGGRGHARNAQNATEENTERGRLVRRLAGIGVHASIVGYPEAPTVEEGKRLRPDLPGTFTKNLLLRDKKGGLFFVTAHEDTQIDLRTLHGKIGAKGRLGLAPADTMTRLLRVGPGGATPLALMNDTAGDIILVVDHRLMGAAQLNFHPMTPSESIGLAWPDFLAFTRSCGHEPVLADLTATAPPSGQPEGPSS